MKATYRIESDVYDVDGPSDYQPRKSSYPSLMAADLEIERICMMFDRDDADYQIHDSDGNRYLWNGEEYVLETAAVTSPPAIMPAAYRTMEGHKT